VAEWKNRFVGSAEVDPRELKPNPLNWREHPEAQLLGLSAVLGDVGWVGRILVNKTTGHIVDGHARRDEAIENGESTVPVDYVSLTEEEERIVLATYDPLGSMAKANQDGLNELIRGVETESDDLRAMLDALVEGEMTIPKEGKTNADDIPTEVDTRTEPGDVWMLGDHRLVCGDASDPETVARLMGGVKADLCFTSPPYAQQRQYTKESKDIPWAEMMRGVFSALPMSPSGQVFVNLGLVHQDGALVTYWDEWLEDMRKFGWRLFGWNIWDQGSGLPGDWNGRLAPSHEFIFHLNRARTQVKKTKRKNAESIRTKGGTGIREKDGSMSGVNSPAAGLNRNKIPDSVIRINRQQAEHLGHPAPFPVALPVEFITAFPCICYEPFCGSGTTIIAAEQVGASCYGAEIAPQYVDIAVKRWELFTGMLAHKEVTS